MKKQESSKINLNATILTDGGVGLTDRWQPTYTERHAVKITFKLGSTFTTSGANVNPALKNQVHYIKKSQASQPCGKRICMCLLRDLISDSLII